MEAPCQLSQPRMVQLSHKPRWQLEPSQQHPLHSPLALLEHCHPHTSFKASNKPAFPDLQVCQLADRVRMRVTLIADGSCRRHMEAHPTKLGTKVVLSNRFVTFFGFHSTW